MSQRIEEGERGLARLSERIAEAAAAVERRGGRERFGVRRRDGGEGGALRRGALLERNGGSAGRDGIAARRGGRAARASRKGSSSPRSPASPPCRGCTNSMDWTSSGVRAVLHHFRNGGVRESAADGIFGIMGDLIETDAEYEKAVEAVLGERMQSVVVRDHADGLSAIHYLKESGEGRSAFVPVGLRIRKEGLATSGKRAWSAR